MQKHSAEAAFVDELDIVPEGYRIPSADEFLGKAPNITNGMETSEYIRKVRDEWDRH